MVKTVPTAMLEEWQTLANRAAQAARVPAALVMRVWPVQIEVLISSLGHDNPYEVHEKADLGTGLYCETVMSTRLPLRVPDALADPAWANNRDVKLNMISYLGVPLVWPDDSIFGTVCVLDSRARHYDATTLQLLQALKAVIEADFAVIEAGDGPTGRNGARMQAFEACIAALQSGGQGDGQSDLQH